MQLTEEQRKEIREIAREEATRVIKEHNEIVLEFAKRLSASLGKALLRIPHSGENA